MPPKGTRRLKGNSQPVPSAEPEPVQPELAPEQAEETTPNQTAKRKKTSFTVEQKEKIIEFLMKNEVIYDKRLAGYKDVTQKEDLWADQAAKVNTTVAQLKLWYTSKRTMMGRLKKRARKSVSEDVITDMNDTEKLVWEKFSFLIPHIETIDARNVPSIVAAATSVSDTERTLSTSQTPVDVFISSRTSTPPLLAGSPSAFKIVSQAASQPGLIEDRRGGENRLTSGEMRELLVECMYRSTAGVSGSSYFGKYIEEALSKLPGEIRRNAEANIIQELHRAQRTAEHSSQIEYNKNEIR